MEKKDRKRKSWCSQPDTKLILKPKQFIWCKSYDHKCLRAAILSDYPVLSRGGKKTRRLMFCVAIRWQACNSELISHESGARLRSFKRWHFIMIFFFLVERELSSLDSLISATVGFFDRQSGQPCKQPSLLQFVLWLQDIWNRVVCVGEGQGTRLICV